MEFLIISGLSGAGKSRAADMLEDLDFYCVDNMPVALLTKFAELCLATGGRYERVALVIDIREKDSFEELFKALDALEELGCKYRILFVEADTDTIVKRYKESRRPHPLALEGVSIEKAVRREIELMDPVREKADFTINTSHLTLAMLQKNIYRLFVDNEGERMMTVNVMSFGFKYGLPIEADLVFDVRFLPNPYYVPELRSKSGEDSDVSAFVLESEAAREFMLKLDELVAFLLPLYVEEGKHTLTIAVGCTGGRHRSVAVAGALAGLIEARGNSAVTLHRDIERHSS